MNSKLKILVTPLCGTERGGWLHPLLSMNLIEMAKDHRYQVEIAPVMDKYPVDYARNCAVKMAREKNVCWLFMIDNDQASQVNPLDVLCGAGADKDIIGLPTMQGQDRLLERGEMFSPNIRILPRENAKLDGEFYTLDKIGGAALFLNHRVWERIPGPWFKWCYNEASELHETDGALSEDYYFCELAQKHGFDLWAHARVIPHFKTTEVSQVGMTLRSMTQR